MKPCIICGKSIADNTIYCPCCGEFNSISGKNLEVDGDKEFVEATKEYKDRHDKSTN